MGTAGAPSEPVARDLLAIRRRGRRLLPGPPHQARIVARDGVALAELQGCSQPNSGLRRHRHRLRTDPARSRLTHHRTLRQRSHPRREPRRHGQAAHAQRPRAAPAAGRPSHGPGRDPSSGDARQAPRVRLRIRIRLWDRLRERKRVRPGEAAVLDALIRKIHEAKESRSPTVTIWGTGTVKREFLHTDDLADAALFLLENVSQPGPINVGTGKDITINELASLIADVIGYHGAFEHDTFKPDGTPRKLLDVSRLKDLGWEAKIGLREGIERTYRAYLESSGVRAGEEAHERRSGGRD